MSACWLCVVLPCGVLALVATARAEDAPPQVTPSAPLPAAVPEAPACVFERYVSVAAAPGFDPHLAEEVRKDLSAELSPRGFGVCPSRAAQGELVAEVALVQREPALVAIQVEDYTTGKRVARDVRLARIPEGGVALALAIAADELLRASWAELMLRRNEAERREREQELAVSTTRPTRMEQPRSVPWHKSVAKVPAALALAVDYAHSARAWDGFSVDLRLQLRPLHYGFFEIGGGALFARPVESDSGTARAAGALALLSVGGCGEPHPRIVLCGGARGSFQWTRFRGSDARAATARRADLTSFVLSALAQAQVRLAAHVFAFAELSLGGALVSALATAREGTVIGVQGLVLGAALGVGYAP